MKTRLLFIIVFLWCSFGLCQPAEEVSSSPLTENKRFKLGLAVSVKIEQHFPLCTDKEKILRVNRIGMRLVSQMKDLKYPYNFTVIEKEDVNAFAIPGGFVYITSGLLDLDFADSEIAFILGHEMTHIEADHAMKQQKVASLTSLILTGLAMYASSGPSQEDPRLARSEAAAKSTALALSGAVVTRGYSRVHEREADFWGRIYAARAGYSPEAAETALERIDAYKQQRPDLLQSLLMTHPYILERIEEAKESIPSFPKETPSEEEIARTSQKIQTAFFQKATYYHQKKIEGLPFILYRRAWQVCPEGDYADNAQFQLMQEWEKLLKKEGRYLIDYYILVKEYESLQEKFPQSDIKEEINKKLAELRTKFAENYQWYRGNLTKEGSIKFYRNFLRLFPESDLREEVRYKLAQKYYEAGKYNQGFQEFLVLIKEASDTPWGEKSRQKITTSLDKVDNILLLQEFLELSFPAPLKQKAEAKLAESIPKAENLEMLASFKEKYPENTHQKDIEERINHLASQLFIDGRSQELSGNWKKAVDIYRKILKFAPKSSSADKVRRRFERIDTLRKEALISAD